MGGAKLMNRLDGQVEAVLELVPGAPASPLMVAPVDSALSSGVKIHAMRPLLLAGLLLCGVGARAGNPNTSLFSGLNVLRAHGLSCPSGPRAATSALRWDDRLARAARQQARYLAGSGRVTHSGPSGSTPRLRAASFGARAVSVSEIVYLGSRPQVQGALNWWTHSAVHCFYMTDPRYALAGASVVTGARGTALVIVLSSGR